MRSVVTSLRRVALGYAFSLLYNRLGFLHEAAGRTVFGEAWNARRRLVVPDRIEGLLVDIGCGEGRLLRSLAAGGSPIIGIEPSPTMASRAARKGVIVVRGTAQRLPLADGSVSHVVCTYPGPWIMDPATWNELTRVTRTGATVSFLLGGSITCGAGSRLRGLITRLAYGSGSSSAGNRLPPLGNESIVGGYEFIEDDWGNALLWRGRRATG